VALRVALCNEVVRGLGFAEQCAFARGVGYDGLEIAPFTLAAEPHRLSPERRREIRRTAEVAGIALAGLHWLLVAPEGLSITSRDEALHARTVEVGCGLVELCADLGGTYLVHGSPAQRALEPGREAEGRRRAAAYFAAVARRAEALGVTYLIEPLAPEQTAFITSVASAVQVAEEIGSPALRSMIDCSAAALGESESIPDLIRRWLPTGLVRHIHFNDPNRRGPGEGALAFAPITAALLGCGYDGWIGVEPFVYEPDGPACAARAAGYVRGLLEVAQ